MHHSIRAITLATAITANAMRASAQHLQMPRDVTHAAHQAQMQHETELKKRGDKAMGFDQDKVTHHFLLRREGGTIQVEAKEAADAQTRELIRAHLQQIAADFSNGDFHLPTATHAEMPAGAVAMKEQKASIAYVFEQTADGGRVVMTASNAAALTAVHDFLRYQIREHKTGDPMTIPE